MTKSVGDYHERIDNQGGMCVQSLIVVVIGEVMRNLNNSHLGGVYTTQRVHRAVRGFAQGFAQERVLILPFLKGVR